MRRGNVFTSSLPGWASIAHLIALASVLASVLALACTTQTSDNAKTLGGAGSSSGGATSAGSGYGGAAPGAGAANVAGASALGGSGNAGGGTAGSPALPPDAGSMGGTDAGPAEADAGGSLDAGTPPLPKRVLLYHFSTLDIPSVPAQITFFKSKLAAWGYDADDSVDPATITDQNLERYAALAMINTCFEPFGKGKPDVPQSQVLQRFLQRGGGLFGTHCASVTFQSATPPVLYNQLIGGRGGNGSFDGASACRTLAAHPTTSALPASFTFTGNLDNTDFVAPDSVVLLKCQWQGGAAKDVTVSWYRSEGLGRVFYTNFAKVAADLSDAAIGPHIVGGLSWVLRLPD